MMNSDQVADLIQRIASTSSKNDKQTLIRQHREFSEFVRVLRAVFDYNITYGMTVKTLPQRTQNEGTEQFDEDHTWALLDNLANRKLTGGSANAAVQFELNRLTVDSATLLVRIITKDLKAGFSESTVNKAIPDCVPEFTCMLAESFADNKDKVVYPAWVEPKLDGFRVIAFVRTALGGPGLIVNRPASVTFYSRSGLEYTTFDHLKEPILKLVEAFMGKLYDKGANAALMADSYAECVLEGEVLSGDFNKTSGDLRRKSEQATDAKFYAFDVLPMVDFLQPGKKGRGMTYVKRRAILEAMIPVVGTVHHTPRLQVVDEVAVHAAFDHFQSLGMEGAMVKNADGQYHRRRNIAWLKLKSEETEDLEIKGWFPGESGTKYEKMIGGYIVDRNGVDVRVGGGFSDEQRAEDPTKNVGRLMEIEFHEVTPDGSLRHSRFKRWRDDKKLKEAA